jgi:hypothetical protein
LLAYVFWHRPEPSVEQATYEHALEHFHRSLAHRPPAGLRTSASLRAPELPWLGSAPGYEDWYLLDDWTSVGVLEEAAVSRGHVSAHDGVASRAGLGTGAVYRLIEGHPELGDTRLAVWVERPAGHEHLSLEALLGDGLDPAAGCLWRRCLTLGPAPELCLLATADPVLGTVCPPAGVGPQRLPGGWTARAFAREALWRD